MTAAFPARRLTAVELTLRSGEQLTAGPLEARGEPDDPGWAQVVAEKVAALIDPARDLAAPPTAGLRGSSPAALLGLACAPIPTAADA
jgi:hypothetical protein